MNKTKTSLFKFGVREVVATGIGTAVFFILLYFIKIPTGVPNTQVNIGAAWLAVLGSVFGPIVGALTAFIGHALNDAISYGSPWWSWVIADAVYGFIVGLALPVVRNAISTKSRIIAFNVYQVVANVIAWIIVAPTLDLIIYSQSPKVVYLQGVTAAVINIISVAIVGTLLLVAYYRTQNLNQGLSKED